MDPSIGIVSFMKIKVCVRLMKKTGISRMYFTRWNAICQIVSGENMTFYRKPPKKEQAAP